MRVRSVEVMTMKVQGFEICELEKLNKVRELAENLGLFVERCGYIRTPVKLPHEHIDDWPRKTQLTVLDKNGLRHEILEMSNNEAKETLRTLAQSV